MTCELRLQLDKLKCAVAICDLRAEPILVQLAMCVRASESQENFKRQKKTVSQIKNLPCLHLIRDLHE